MARKSLVPVGPNEKWCPKGKHALPLNHFFKLRSGKFDGWCEECRRAYNKARDRKRA